MPNRSLHEIQDFYTRKFASILFGYRKNCAASTTPSQVWSLNTCTNALLRPHITCTSSSFLNHSNYFPYLGFRYWKRKHWRVDRSLLILGHFIIIAFSQWAHHRWWHTSTLELQLFMTYLLKLHYRILALGDWFCQHIWRQRTFEWKPTGRIC